MPLLLDDSKNTLAPVLSTEQEVKQCKQWQWTEECAPTVVAANVLMLQDSKKTLVSVLPTEQQDRKS